MNFLEVQDHEDTAIDIIASVINKAREKLGNRQNLSEIAKTREELANRTLLSLASLEPPLAINSEKLIRDAIEKTWKLTKVLMYHLKYHGGTTDECSHFYYFEAIFSQPSQMYPIPQTTCSVFFRVEDKHIEPPVGKATPLIIFRIEGHHAEHDIRYTRLIPDWIMAVMMMKMKFFRRIEKLGSF